MSKGLASPLPDTITELKRQLKQAEDEQRKYKEDAAKSVRIVWKYVITWKSKYVFYCHRELTEASKIEIINWENFYQSSHPRKPHRGLDVKEGMEYVLIGNMLVMAGGGTLTLKTTEEHNHFSHEPRKLTPDEASALREGLVPDSLKMYG